MSSSEKSSIVIQGTVAPGFESVKRLYEHNMNTLVERNTQLCVYYKDEKVVDLWATACQDTEFSADSLVNIFSSGKSFEAIAISYLAGKGLIDYRARVSVYWPEFAHQGKGELTVAELMRHEAGLANLNQSIDPQDLLRENIKLNKIGKIFEEHPQAFRNGDDNRREYHAISRGWIVNEVFRRVDPAGRTIGEFLREEINTPLQVDVEVGIKEEDLPRISKVKVLGVLFQFIESLKPKFLKRKMELNIFQILAKIFRIVPAMRNTTAKGAPPALVGMKEIAFFNDNVFSMGETPSANTKSNARALAKVAAMMSAGGKWEGAELINPQGWAALHDDPIERNMAFMGTTFTQGGVNLFSHRDASSAKDDIAFNNGREGFFGWMGLGGSIFQWNPEHRIGFGYVPTSLYVLDFLNERGKAYQGEVLACVERINN